MSAADDDGKVVALKPKRMADGDLPLSEDEYGANPDDRPPAFSDESLALRFAQQYGDKLRYVALWGKWLIWDGTAWRKDETMRSFDLARAICRAAAAECNKPKAATAIASAKTVAAVERLAKADRKHASTHDQWDRDPWLLNTPRGIVDLTNGSLRPSDPARHMTKTTAATPFGECPMWLKFLVRITDNDARLQSYLQRVAGYCLTGLIKEHALFFGHGTGRNGKGTFLNTITAILADYAIVANIETFTASGTSRHLTELARLQGARLVVSQETEEGKHLAEARVKAITGGDPITANFMRQDHFTFVPQFKLFIAGNHKPALRYVDEAIRARFNMIPFLVTIPREERDRELEAKLKAEWPGILQWMVEGCLAWQHEGLNPPPAVLTATEEYFEGEDSLAIWMDQCCKTGPFEGAIVSQLFRNWTQWAKAAGEEPGTRKKFSANLQARGFALKRTTDGYNVNGLGLRIAQPHSETENDRA